MEFPKTSRAPCTFPSTSRFGSSLPNSLPNTGFGGRRAGQPGVSWPDPGPERGSDMREAPSQLAAGLGGLMLCFLLPHQAQCEEGVTAPNGVPWAALGSCCGYLTCVPPTGPPGASSCLPLPGQPFPRLFPCDPGRGTARNPEPWELGGAGLPASPGVPSRSEGAGRTWPRCPRSDVRPAAPRSQHVRSQIGEQIPLR